MILNKGSNDCFALYCASCCSSAWPVPKATYQIARIRLSWGPILHRFKQWWCLHRSLTFYVVHWKMLLCMPGSLNTATRGSVFQNELHLMNVGATKSWRAVGAGWIIPLDFGGIKASRFWFAHCRKQSESHSPPFPQTLLCEFTDCAWQRNTSSFFERCFPCTV